MIQQLYVDTSSALQEAQSVSNYVQDRMICIPTIEPQAFLDGNMDEVMIYMSNKPAKRSPRIKLMIFFSLQRIVTLISGSVRLLPLLLSFVFVCLNTFGIQCRMRFRYLAPWLKSFIFQVLIWSLSMVLTLALLKGKWLILTRILAVSIPTKFINQNTTIRQRQRIPLNILPLPPSGWVHYSKKLVLQKPDIMGHLHSWTSKRSSMIPLESNLGCITSLNKIRNPTMSGESWKIRWCLSTWCFHFCMSDRLRWYWYFRHHVLHPRCVYWDISVVSGMEVW